MERESLNGDALLAAAGSDPESFAAFYRLFERPVLGFFMKATGSPELAADLTAETFARALESVDGYDTGRGRADQWLFGIARNVLGSSYRTGRVGAKARERLGMGRLVVDDHAALAIARVRPAFPSEGGAQECCRDRSPLISLTRGRAGDRGGGRNTRTDGYLHSA